MLAPERDQKTHRQARETFRRPEVHGAFQIRDLEANARNDYGLGLVDAKQRHLEPGDELAAASRSVAIRV